MYKLSATGQKLLKGLHLFTVSCWVGGAFSLVLLYFLKQGMADGGVIHGVDQSIHWVDMKVVVIPGAFGCLLTGLAYSLFTRWGFIRHGFIILKWLVTLGAIIFGTFWLGPWERAMMGLSGELGAAAPANAAYLHNQLMHEAFGAVQCAVLIFVVFISIFKPWKNLGKGKKG